MTTRIDLSALSRPTIPGLILTLEEVHAEMIAWLLAEYQWELSEDASEPAWRVSRLLAGREAIMRQSVGDAMAAVSLPYATGEILDHVGNTYWGLRRLADEGDDAYRVRIANAPERFAVGLSGPWYESIARGVEGVADARVTTPAAGDVDIYILANETLLDAMDVPLYANGIPTATLLAAVTPAVTAKDTRQQADTVVVRACVRQLYDVLVSLTLRAEPDSERVLADARAGLADLAARTDLLGGSLTKDLIAGASVNVAAVSAAVVTLEAIDAAGVATVVDSIASMDSVAPKHRNLVVALA